MSDLSYLQMWLYFVASLRTLSVFIGYLNPEKFRTNLFSRARKQVSELYGRTFAIWTAVTCTLCVLCARNMQERGIYAATLLSFVFALLHFTSELVVYKTMSPTNILSPGIVATVSVVWMWMERPHEDLF